jgi:trigger factor
MQVTETSNNGLKRELKVVIGKDEIEKRFQSRVENFKGQVQLKGFRKGKVPSAHVKKLYGRSLMGEVLQETLDETSRQAIVDRKERPAMQPKVELSEDKEVIEQVIDGKSDLHYTMSFEVLPEIALSDLSALLLERDVADVEAAEIDKGVDELINRSVSYEAEDGRTASEGDQVIIDFVGSIDGVDFEGGKGDDMKVVIGAGGFIPGFEDGLKGAKAGDSKVIDANFPEGYPAEKLAGKTAKFATTVKSINKPIKPEANDEFAKTLGVDSIEKLRELIKAQIQQQHDQLSRARIKRQLLDQLDKTHSFELPEALVTTEFDGIWQQVTQGLEQAKKTFADEGKTEDSAREEYTKIAQRRVRLGLVIGEIGDKQKMTVTQDELRRALIERARAYPGQEKFVYEYYEKNPAALTELRAPIFEEKVVDYILTQAKVTEKKVTREDLLKAANEDETANA